MSAFRRQSVAPASVRRNIHRPVEPYPILDLKDIAASLQDISRFPIDEDLLSRPTQQYVANLYGDIIECFVGISDQHLRTALETAAEKVGNGETDTQADARLLLGLHRHVFKFMKDCGVDDFNIVDIVKPEPMRLRRNLSAVIAFAQFREDRMHDYSDLVNQCKQLTGEFQLLEDEHEELMNQIGGLEDVLRDNSDQAKQTQEHNIEVESELRKLKKVQEQLTIEHSNYKQEKQRLINKLENQSLLVVEARKENDRIRPYIVDSPQMLQKINSDLGSSLQLTKSNVENIERRLRSLKISTETFKQINQDLQACIKVMEECESELEKEQEATRKLNRFQEILEQRKQEDQDMNVRVTQLQRQIANSQEKIERAKKQAEIKRASAEKKMMELRDSHGTLAAERSLQMKEKEEKREYIKITELQISGMKEHLESEMRAIMIESEKLRDHLQLYLSSMEQRIKG